MIGGSIRVLRLFPPLKLVAMIYLNYCWTWCVTSKMKSNQSSGQMDHFLALSKMSSFPFGYIYISVLCLMVFNATFNNISITSISWLFVLLMEETGEPGENHWPVVSHRQTLSHNVVHFDLIEIWTHNISGDRHNLSWADKSECLPQMRA
jgi:hypothetical protein